jgi:flagellar basal-body rod protein FlgB
MFLQRLFNQGSAPLLEQVLSFTAARQRLIAENIANIDTPGFRQKDLSVERFQQMLRDRLAQREAAAPGSVGFDDLRVNVSHPQRGILFHDRNNRSTEQLMTDQAKNALMHNVAVELLRKQYSTMEMALRERIA